MDRGLRTGDTSDADPIRSGAIPGRARDTAHNQDLELLLRCLVISTATGITCGSRVPTQQLEAAEARTGVSDLSILWASDPRLLLLQRMC